MEFVIAFVNTSSAIKAEQCLLERKINLSVLPLPSQMRAGCGICLRVNAESIKASLEALQENQINGIDVFSRTEQDGRFEYKEENVINLRSGE